MKKIEVITMNVRDTLQVEELGVDRVELVSAMKGRWSNPKLRNNKKCLGACKNSGPNHGEAT